MAGAGAAVQRPEARAPTVMLESSIRLSLQTATTYAETGVDYLAVEALTHSVRVLDIGGCSRAAPAPPGGAEMG